MSLMQLVFIVFLILKLIGQVDWSWWWIASPLIVELSIQVAMLIWKEVDPVSFARFWGGRRR